MRTLAIHSNHVRCLAYSPDGKLLATASNDRSVRVLDAAAGREISKWGSQRAVMQAVAFHPAGERIAFGGQRPRVSMDSWRSGELTELQHHFFPIWTSVTSLAFLPDGETLLAGTGDRILRSERGHLRIYDVEPFRERAVLEIPGGVHHLAVRPDGKQVVLGTGHSWRIVETASWKADDQVVLHDWTVPAVAYSPDGSLIAVAKGFSIRLHQTADLSLICHLNGHRGKVVSLAFTPDGRHLVSGSWDRTVRIWPVAGGPETALAWERGKVQHVAVAPDGMTAAAACDKGVVLWDLDA